MNLYTIEKRETTVFRPSGRIKLYPAPHRLGNGKITWVCMSNLKYRKFIAFKSKVHARNCIAKVVESRYEFNIVPLIAKYHEKVIIW